MAEKTAEELPVASCCGSCGGDAAADAQPAAAEAAVREVFRVQGMTCGHCVSAVTAEVSRISGVTGVGVDLGSGKVTVDSDKPLDEKEVAAAIDEAGYELVGRV